MIIGVGHDAVAIVRFAHWHTYSHKKLRRIFSEQEIQYCLQEPRKSTERFAARFAAKEALFKALCQAGCAMPFLRLCAMSELIVTSRGVYILTPVPYKISVSITHTEQYAYALILLQST